MNSTQIQNPSLPQKTRIKILFHTALITLVTAVTFYPILSNGFFAIDDNVMLYNNTKIMKLSLESAAGYFTSFHWLLYHPLVLLSYAVEFYFYKLNAACYHMTSLYFHIFNALFVYWLFLLLARNRLAAFITAILFAIHPLHVESVAWISERKDLLYALFFLLSCISYVYYIKGKKKINYYGSWALFLLALFSKPMAVTLPFVLLLFDHMTTGNITKEAFKNKLPFFALSAGFSIIALIGQGSYAHPENLKLLNIMHNSLEAVYNVIFYVFKTVYPAHLSVIYPRYLEQRKLLNIYLFYSPVMLSFMAAAVIYSLRYTKKLYMVRFFS